MTTTGYGISGIGNPMGLGTYGLSAPGMYGSYDNYMPSMMGMNGSIFGASAMNPMMAMYNPAYMTQLQQQIEASQLTHANNMHAGVLGNEVAAHRRSDSALIQKVLTDSDIQYGVQNLYEKVQKGDQKGIREEFDKLKSYVYQTYGSELDDRGDKINRATSANRVIEIAYSRIISAQNGGQVANLRDDIVKYGESAFKNGFMQGFRRGHQGQYIDETINHCFGLRINQKEHQDALQGLGELTGRGASVLEKAAYGAGLGAATYTIGGGVVSLGGKSFNVLKNMKFNPKTMGKFAIVAAGLAAVGDILWQMAEPKTA